MGRSRKVPINTDDKPKTTRKRKNAKKEEEVEEDVKEEHVIVQLPINTDTVSSILKENDIMLNPLEYMPNLIDPLPYSSDNYYETLNSSCDNNKNNELQNSGSGSGSDSNNLQIGNNNNIDVKNREDNFESNKSNCCYWCCHSIGPKEFGMPIKYDTIHKTFTTFGYFCSLECTVAYNYSANMGSDRMWEIHSWIQWIGKKIGYQLPIRPAPSKYLLKMFNGPLDIEEFRNVHNNYLKTYIMNMPPLIHIQGQMETVNTSFVSKVNTSYINNSSSDKNDSEDETAGTKEKVKLSRKKQVMDMNKTLDAKMNLTIKSVKLN